MGKVVEGITFFGRDELAVAPAFEDHCIALSTGTVQLRSRKRSTSQKVIPTLPLAFLDAVHSDAVQVRQALS